MLAVGCDGPKLGFLVGARNQVAACVEIHSVGAPRRLEKRGKFTIHTPLHDAIVRLIGEKDVALLVARRAFGEFEIARKFLQLRARSDDG